VLYLKTGAVLDYEANPQLDVTVAVDDASVGSTPDDTASLSAAITNANEPPGKPTGSAPVDGATAVILTPTLESSVFSDPDAGDTHAATQWQMDDDSGFPSPVWDYSDTDADKTRQAVPPGTLSYNAVYYWRVRYQDSQGAWSEWSAFMSFATASGLSAVYRFWSPVFSTHFYTISAVERDFLINNYSHAWTYEGVAYYAFADSSQPGVAPVYRFWSGHSHFYTIDVTERDWLLNNYSSVWTYEGVAFYAYAKGSQPVGTHAVYRFWSGILSTHFFTISPTERDWLISNYSAVWTDEGLAWYAYG